MATRQPGITPKYGLFTYILGLIYILRFSVYVGLISISTALPGAHSYDVVAPDEPVSPYVAPWYAGLCLGPARRRGLETSNMSIDDNDIDDNLHSDYIGVTCPQVQPEGRSVY